MPEREIDLVLRSLRDEPFLKPDEVVRTTGSNLFFFFQAVDGIRDGHVTGVQTCALPISPLWTTLSSSLIEERSGTTSTPVDGAIVVETWQEPDPPGDADQQSRTRATESLFEGLMRGFESTSLPVVGVQTTGAEPDLALFRQQGVSSVDDVDTLAGRLALALLLQGAQPGHYGVKDSATDGVAPPIEPVTTTTGG